MFDFLFNHRCYRGGPMHKFGPRYTKKESSESLENILYDCTSDEVKPELARALANTLVDSTVYHGDVCEWCGKITNSQTVPNLEDGLGEHTVKLGVRE